MTRSSAPTTGGPHPQPYFHHGERRAIGEPRPISPVTRYLCGAAYVDERFVERVIGELIEDEQRAVAPSYGYDLEPVVRHCFRARRLWLAQNAVLTAILIAGLCAIGGATLITLCALLLIAIPVGLRRGAHLEGRKVTVVAALGVLGALLVLPILGIVAVRMAVAAPTAAEASSLHGPSAKALLLEVLLLVLALGGTLTWARYTMLRTLTTDLAPGAVHQPPPMRSKRVEDRLETVARAQRGNVAVHGGKDPFLGAGRVLRSWAVVVELLPEGGDGILVDPVDPVALNRHVKRRVAALRSRDLPERQRISGLTVRDYVVASGVRSRDYPLIGPDRVPYEMASTEAVEAIIRHPQASARHFLRATTGTEGKEVMLDGQRLLLAEDQEVQVSAFVHLAVEGGLLYVEYVATVLGAVKDDYHDIDQLPVNPQNLLGRAAMDALRRLSGGTLLAPLNLIRGVYRAAAVSSRMNSARRQSGEAIAYNYGARESIRQSSSSSTPDTYTRRLDAQKYSKLIERRVNDAVLDYLESQGVDTSEYRARTNVIHNHNMYVQDSTVYGSIASGHGATATTYTTHVTGTFAAQAPGEVRGTAPEVPGTVPEARVGDPLDGPGTPDLDGVTASLWATGPAEDPPTAPTIDEG